MSSTEDASASMSESPALTGAEAPRARGELMKDFAFLGTAVQGAAHQRMGAQCDDRFAWHSLRDRYCAVVADGAGSARFGRVGAHLASAVLARDMLETMIDAPLTVEGVSAAAKAGLLAIRDSLLQYWPETRLSDYHATIVGAIWSAEGGFLFHIGDGVAAGIESRFGSPMAVDAWENARVSQPENGESADQTYFFTMDPIHIRVTEVTSPSAIVLMTDGAASVCYTHKSSKLEGGFFAPIASYLSRTGDPEKLSAQLTNVMRSDQAGLKSDDDKCIVIALKGSSLPA